MTRLRSLSWFALDVPLNEPFGIATGAQHSAQNVFVQLELEDGTVGTGEAAPVLHISGETQSDVLCVLKGAEQVLKNRDLRDFRAVSCELRLLCGATKSALAGLEVALLDALCRHFGCSMRAFFGGRETTLSIDVTVTTGSEGAARRAAARFREGGFTSLKIKVGALDIDLDIARLRAIVSAAPGAKLILDGNTAYAPADALRLLSGLGPLKERIVAFEQPVAREDWEGLREVEAKGRVPVIADESLRSREDFERLARMGGISGVNLKTAKLGLFLAADLLTAARALGLRTMVGGMVETEVSMSASACLAAGVGGVDYVDLDTPLFLGERPIQTVIQGWGPSLDLSPIEHGHGAGIVAQP